MTALAQPMDSQDFRLLFEAVRAGDDRALDILCERFYPRVRRHVHRSLARSVRRRHPWLAAMFSTGDIVQDVFLGVVADIEDVHLESEEACASFLATLTRHRLVDAIRFFEASRRDRRRDDLEPDQVDQMGQSLQGPEDAAIAREQIARFHHVLATFSARDRALLRERIENRLPFDELSNMLGYASADSTRKAFHVAQAKLLTRLRRRNA